MDSKHQSYLENTCRICSSHIDKHERRKPVLKYISLIHATFKHDLTLDDNRIYPQHVCKRCTTQLDRLNSGFVLDGTFELPFFKPHDEGCVCLSKAIRHKKNKTFSLKNVCKFSLEVFEDKASLVDLHKIPLSGELVYFAKYELVNFKPSIGKFIGVNVKGEWKAFCDSLDISHLFPNVPHLLTLDSIDMLLNAFSNIKRCEGNMDYSNLINSSFKEFEQHFYGKNGEILGSIQSLHGDSLEDISTIRATDCELVLFSGMELRCSHCKNFRQRLNNAVFKLNKKVASDVKKHTNYTYLSKGELCERLRTVEKDKSSLRGKLSRLQNKVSKLLESEAIPVENDLHELCDIVTSERETPFDKDSPLYLLWEQQKKSVSRKSPKGMRWHPLIIRWCMSIYLKSPGTYKHIRNTGFLKLPSKSTLINYCNFTESSCGFNPDILKLLLNEVKDCQDFQKNVGILFDEMKIKSNLVYNKGTGKLIGFCDYGELNNELDKFTKMAEDESEESQDRQPELASYVLTLMAKGIFSNLSFPFAYFAGTGFTSNQLYNSLWDAVHVLESIGLKVWFLCSDGAAPNRRFYSLHKLGYNLSSDGVVYWTYNKHAFPERRKIYFICDVPHLMKTTRNNFSNSGAHAKTRNLVINGREVRWQHIIDLLYFEQGNSAAPGLYMTKLSKEHICLTPRSRMNVSLAVQVLHQKVAYALSIQNLPCTLETRNFITYMFRFFSCLNVKNKKEGFRKRNEYLLPYTQPNDSRLEWLLNDFLGFINKWKCDSDSQTHLSKSERAKLCLSGRTIEGLRITVHSFVELVPQLLSIDGAKYVLSDKFNQDSLEEHFYRQRSRGGANENPTLHEYGFNETKLQICKSNMIRAMGNSKGKERDQIKFNIYDMSPLPKKQKDGGSK